MNNIQKWTCLSTLPLSLALSPASAQEQRPLTNGNQLLEACRGDNGAAEQLACGFYIDGIVGGYMMAVGLHDVDSAMCVPDEMTGAEVNEAVVLFLENNAEIRNESSRVLIAMAIIQAFPCNS